MNELALFAGGGGGILGGKLLGWTTICAVEIEEYPREVLKARQEDGTLPAFPIWDDVSTFDGVPWRGVVDIVTGGFPCQDISAAGKGAGIAGERSGLWGEMARIIREVGPRFVLVENSPMLTSRGLGRVVGDLAAMGYDARWGVLGAVDAGAPHKRERIWIVAYAKGTGSRGAGGWDAAGLAGPRRSRAGAESLANPADNWTGRREQQPQSGEGSGNVADPAWIQPGWEDERPEWERTGPCRESVEALANASGRRCDRSDSRESEQPRGTETERRSETLANADGAGLEEQRSAGANGAKHEAAECGSWWLTEPDVGRVADGVAARVDRLKAIGNGQVPQCAASAWRILTHNAEVRGRAALSRSSLSTDGLCRTGDAGD